MRFIIKRNDSEYFEDTLECYEDGSFKSYWFTEHEDFCAIVDLLNQLNDENEKLKKDLEHCANQFTNDGKNVLLSLR